MAFIARMVLVYAKIASCFFRETATFCQKMAKLAKRLIIKLTNINLIFKQACLPICLVLSYFTPLPSRPLLRRIQKYQGLLKQMTCCSTFLLCDIVYHSRCTIYEHFQDVSYGSHVIK
jgi:hypothetical protein